MDNGLIGGIIAGIVAVSGGFITGHYSHKTAETTSQGSNEGIYAQELPELIDTAKKLLAENGKLIVEKNDLMNKLNQLQFENRELKKQQKIMNEKLDKLMNGALKNEN